MSFACSPRQQIATKVSKKIKSIASRGREREREEREGKRREEVARGTQSRREIDKQKGRRKSAQEEEKREPQKWWNKFGDHHQQQQQENTSGVEDY